MENSINQNNAHISVEEDSRKVRFYSIDVCRFILMLFAGISIMNFPTPYGKLIQIISGFAIPCFYVLSGFLVFREKSGRSKKILRTIKRTAICFTVLAVCYFVLNFAIFPDETLKTVATKRFWFDFIILNEWGLKLGTTIWYVQSLLYAYIILYFLDKYRLLRYDWPIVILCIAFTILTGDLAGVIGFNFLGHRYITGNFITRAIPYLIIGRIIAKKRPFPNYITIIAGIVLIFLEMVILRHFNVLVYSGHLIGKTLLGIGVSIFIIAYSSSFSKNLYSSYHIWGTKFLYFVMQPAYVLVKLLLKTPNLTDYIGIITILICIAVFSILYFVCRVVAFIKEFA